MRKTAKQFIKRVEVRRIVPAVCFECGAPATVRVEFRDPNQPGPVINAVLGCFGPLYSALACDDHAATAVSNVMSRAGLWRGSIAVPAVVSPLHAPGCICAACEGVV